MKLHIDNNTGFRIAGYSSAGIIINETIYQGPLIIQSDAAPEPWAARVLDDIDQQSLQPCVDRKPEILLIGTGQHQQFPAMEQVAFLYASAPTYGFGFEIMGTAAACRTFNILVSEERRVIAAVLPLA